MGSLGKDAAAAAERVVLAVNSARHEAAGVDPSTTLLEFLRTRTPVRGPKLGCGEGEHPSTTQFISARFNFSFSVVRSDGNTRIEAARPNQRHR
uniref:Uncharacterized protein n=1 Tax=Aegilops tauschii subsp. strangulata TaxID=200361 RepID=A0A453M0R9_AEGTS